MCLQSRLNWIALLAVLLLTACAQSNKNYYDISELEKPPQLEIVPTKAESGRETPSQTEADAEKKVSTGLGDAVVLIDESHLLLKQPLDKAWKSIETALTISKIEITDRDLDKGLYFVNYVADDSKAAEPLGGFNFSFLNSDVATSPFLVTVKEQEGEVEIQVQPAEDSEKPAAAVPADAAEKLLKKLFLSLHDELPLE